MALLFIDGFDVYGANNENANAAIALAGWEAIGHVGNTVSVVNTTRTGIGYALNVDTAADENTVTMNFKTSAAIAFGFAMQSNSVGFCHICQVGYNNYVGNVGANRWTFDDGNGGSTANQLQIYSNGANGITAETGTGVLIGVSAPNCLYNDVWQYLEVEYTPGTGTSGMLEIKVDGLTVLLCQSCLTQNPAWPALVNYFSFFATGTNELLVDDFYLCDQTGASFNTFLGDVVVHAILPDSDAGPNTMTATGGTGGTHFGAVDDAPSNLGTSYVSSNTSGQKEVYGLSPFPADIVDVLAMSVCVLAEKTAPGVGLYQSLAIINSFETDSPEFSAPMSYVQSQFLVTAPPGGGTWTLAMAQASTIGVTIP